MEELSPSSCAWPAWRGKHHYWHTRTNGCTGAGTRARRRGPEIAADNGAELIDADGAGVVDSPTHYY
jgi:hypothetical protein